MIYNNYGNNTGVNYEKQDWNTGLNDAIKSLIKENGGKFDWISKEWIIPSNKIEGIKQFEIDWYKEYYKDCLSFPVNEMDRIDIDF